MREVKNIRTKQVTSLDRLLGEEAKVIEREVIAVNRFVHIELLKVSFQENHSLGEDGGRLFLYPVADGEYYLHLLYCNPDQEMTEPEIYSIQFAPEFFLQFDEEILQSNAPFRFDKSTEQQFVCCNTSKNLLEQLRKEFIATPFLQSLQLTEIAVQLLRKAIENISIPFAVCAVPACRFLSNESEREKIFEARAILEATLHHPLTIKELSRKVAMNECYLKKGFKTITGKTINEYQQYLRITKAKELLKEKGNTVSEVANELGYSSISHFSTAFKKATGLKPCELLG